MPQEIANKTTSKDRLSFTAFAAVAAHVILILGISFTLEDPKPAPYSMEITLSLNHSEYRDDDAQFLAQHNQQGSGNQAEETAFSTVDLREASLLGKDITEQQAMRRAQAESVAASVVTSQRGQEQATPLRPEKASNQVEYQDEFDQVAIYTREIASLQARLDQQIRNYSDRPKIKRVTAASTLAATDAEYTLKVINQIESMGKYHMPTSDQGRPVYGETRLAISIRADGSLHDVYVLQGSRNLVVDDAAIRIVKLVAPFDPFPEEVRKERDILEMIRTFSFQRKGISSF